MSGAQAFFLPAAQGQRYCLYHPPQGPVRSRVLYVHPFAEELNRTRRMAAMQSRALAAAGHAVLQVDLLGCGDSSGDFGDAHWETWIDDLLLAHQWLVRQPDGGGREVPLWLWGLRAGSLLAADTARRLQTPCHLLLWQPSFADGSMQLQQFLRLRLAADMLRTPDPAEKRSMATLQQQLAQGEALEIAGYTLSAVLAAGLKASKLSPPPADPAAGRRMVWLETSAGAAPALTPLGARAQDAWRQAGWQTSSQVVAGPAFWQSTEIEEAPALVAATVQALGGETP